MSAGFYRAFEDRYRGSRETITQRLQAYLPFLEPLKALYADYPVLDLGCGRGEWLELMVREGFAPLVSTWTTACWKPARRSGCPRIKTMC